MELIAIISSIASKIPVVEFLSSRRRAKIEHDRRLLQEFDRLLSDESLDEFLDELSNHLLMPDTLTPIRHYVEWSDRIRNQFLLRSLQTKHKDFSEQLAALKSYGGQHFFPRRNFFALRPEQNPKYSNPNADELEYFNEVTENLRCMIQGVDSAYKRFRSNAKRRLHC